MGNNVMENFCGCKENEESEKQKLEKVNIYFINFQKLFFNIKECYYRISKKIMTKWLIVFYQVQKTIL